jgi:putative acetyltransferase
MIEVRAVEPTDVPGVLSLVADVLGEYGLEFGKGSPTDAELHGLPDSYVGRGGAFWVAQQGGALLGTCGVFPVAPGTYELRKMYLRGTSRGLGLGKRLLDVAVDWARAHGGARMVLDTVEQMTRAIAFYEANGFVRDDAQVRGARCTRGYVRVIG